MFSEQIPNISVIYFWISWKFGTIWRKKIIQYPSDDFYLSGLIYYNNNTWFFVYVGCFEKWINRYMIICSWEFRWCGFCLSAIPWFFYSTFLLMIPRKLGIPCGMYWDVNSVYGGYELFYQTFSNENIARTSC